MIDKDGAPTTRRQLLATVGIASVAGCIDPFSSESSDVLFGSILISNATSSTRSVSVHVHRNNETVYDDSVEVAADEHEIIDPTWPSEPARYTVRYEISDDVGELSLPDDSDVEDCNYLFIYLNEFVGVDVHLYGDPPNDEVTC